MEQTKFELKFINPLTDDYDVYNINTSNRSRIGFDRLKPFETQKDLINIIDNLLISIDCTKLICNMPQTKIGCYKYDSDMSDLIYYCSKLVNPIEYESYIKRISEIHAHNVALLLRYGNLHFAVPSPDVEAVLPGRMGTIGR